MSAADTARHAIDDYERGCVVSVPGTWMQLTAQAWLVLELITKEQQHPNFSRTLFDELETGIRDAEISITPERFLFGQDEVNSVLRGASTPEFYEGWQKAKQLFVDTSAYVFTTTGECHAAFMHSRVTTENVKTRTIFKTTEPTRLRYNPSDPENDSFFLKLKRKGVCIH